MFNFGKKKNRYEPGKLLFKLFDGQAGLPCEPGYDAVTLNATESRDKLCMVICSRPAGDGEVESKTTYIVSAKVLDDVMKLVKKHRLVERRGQNYPCMCGRITYCNFIWEGELVRVSSDSMLENGEEVFADISAVLYAYADPSAISDKSN